MSRTESDGLAVTLCEAWRVQCMRMVLTDPAAAIPLESTLAFLVARRAVWLPVHALAATANRAFLSRALPILTCTLVS